MNIFAYTLCTTQKVNFLIYSHLNLNKKERQNNSCPLIIHDTERNPPPDTILSSIIIGKNKARIEHNNSSIITTSRK